VHQSLRWTTNQPSHSVKIPSSTTEASTSTLCHHFIQDCVKEGIIVVGYTVTAEQLADLLTKAVGRTQFQELRDKIGMKATDDHVRD
jgi:flavorubredoxin